MWGLFEMAGGKTGGIAHPPGVEIAAAANRGEVAPKLGRLWKWSMRW
jgi:hypothetical protein